MFPAESSFFKFAGPLFLWNRPANESLSVLEVRFPGWSNGTLSPTARHRCDVSLLPGR